MPISATTAVVTSRNVCILVEHTAGKQWGRSVTSVACGKKWLSGAVEWDHLGDWERKRRIRDTVLLSVLFSVASSVMAAVVYLAMHTIGIGRGVFSVAAVIAVLPAVLIIVPFVFQVAASVLRTRTGTGNVGE